MAEGAAGLVDVERRGRTAVVAVRVAEAYSADVLERLSRDIHRAIETAGAAGADAYVLDLSAVRFLTSAALGMIINLRAHLAGRGHAFVLAGATGNVAKVLAHAHLADILPIFPTAEEAVRRLNPCARDSAE